LNQHGNLILKPSHRRGLVRVPRVGPDEPAPYRCEPSFQSDVAFDPFGLAVFLGPSQRDCMIRLHCMESAIDVAVFGAVPGQFVLRVSQRHNQAHFVTGLDAARRVRQRVSTEVEPRRARVQKVWP
jgi:hypothetical protein